MSLFVDSSIWYAAAVKSESTNIRAKTILSEHDQLVTTDHVLAETCSLLHHRIGRRAAERFWGQLRAGLASIEFVGPSDLEFAWQIGQAWHDQDFSLVDLSSFAVMIRLGLERVASLDDHFSIFRFGPRRRGSFVVVR
ncbi:MAG TPA: PIN domain-containing protein [Terracidiphilus sp.]|nr:PIN domain-containing protein [Terracidiphilus sp.]